MYHKVLPIIFLVVVVNATSLFLTGCFDPIVVERETDPKLDIWYKELPTAPGEQVFAVGRNRLSIAAVVIDEIENANPDIQITDIEKLKSEIGYTSDGLLLPDVVSRLRTHRLNRLGEEVLIAIEAESIGKHRFGVPPYDLRAGAYIVNLYAIIVPLEENRSVTQLNVRVITGGSALLFPLPVIVETVDELNPHGKAQKVLGQEIGKFLDKYYESKPVNVTIVWLSAVGMQESASRHYSALSPEEIKKQEEERSEIIRKRAEEGDAEAMYLIFDALSSNIKEPVAAWEWLCKAADQGYVKAQVEIAHWHRTTTWEFGQPDRLEWLREAGIHADDQIAYLWYTIAAREDDNRLRTRNNLFYGKLTEEGIIEAKDMVRNWKPGQCQRDLVTDTSKQ